MENPAQSQHAIANTIVFQALLPRSQAEAVMTYSNTHCAWQHGCLHLPTFKKECIAFWSLPFSERPLDQIDPSWLSLYLACQALALNQIGAQDAAMCGLTLGTCQLVSHLA